VGFKLDKSVLTALEFLGFIAALKGLGSVTEHTHIECTLDKLGANADAVLSLHEPVVIDLASHYKGDLTAKIETIKQAILANNVVEFDYFYEKGESRRRIEPHVVIFRWTSWYVFGFCLERQDWRMFKLNRLWYLSATDEQFAMREIPPERRNFDSHFVDGMKLVALFDKSAKYQLVETYGLDSFYEDDEGLHFEFGYTNRNHTISWLLGFGDRVKVLEPPDFAEEIQVIAKNILKLYET